MNGFFITGTDTEIGKSLVSATLLHAFALQGRQVVGMKPFAAGCDAQGQNEDVTLIRAYSNVAVPPALTCPYLLQEACAPLIAAALEGVSFDLSRVQQSFDTLASQADCVVVEGVGGFRVPLQDGLDTSDLAMQLNLPVVMVVGLRLGCINHALLTAEAIRARGLRLVAWVANQIDPAMRHVDANLNTLKETIAAPCLGHIPHLIPATPEAALQHVNVALLNEF